MTAVIIFGILSILLVVGKALRVHVPFLQRLYLPSSVIGGLVGLILFTMLGDILPTEWTNSIRRFPGFLINVIFATLFLGVSLPKFGRIIGVAFPQLCLGQFVVWGQFVVGIGVAGFLLSDAFGVSPAFGNLLELGFEGGHGTVGGMEETFRSVGWEDGIALGYTVATVGMIMGIVIGMALVNHAYAHGYVKTVRPFDARSLHERLGVYPRHRRPSAGRQSVLSDSVDSLAWHIAVVGLAVIIGYLMLLGLQCAEQKLFPSATERLFKGFPLFPLCMIGGVLLQTISRKTRLKLLIDRQQMQRISGAALDYLSLSAVATIQISVVARNWLPLLILMLAGVAWTVTSIMWLAPRIFKDAWFERAIAEFGQATGVTATGLLLLRTVDPDNKTCAAAAFGYKQMVNEPLMGAWVAFAFMLAFTKGWMPVWLISCGVLVFWSIASFIVIKRNRAN